jgi:AcrR family transcriptional regulator
MRRRHSLDEVRAAAAATLRSVGIAKLTYRAVAERMGTSDRMIVYYLPSKQELVEAALLQLSGDLQTLLLAAFGTERRTVDQLAQAAWPVLSSDEGVEAFRVFFEVVGLATRDESYAAFARLLLDSWVDWLATLTTGRTIDQRRRAALGLVARIEGTLLVGQVVGAPARAAAAAANGFT